MQAALHDFLPSTPSESSAPQMTRHMLVQYHKQMVTSRLLSFHQQTLRMMAKDKGADPVAKKQMVIKRVARELWTNFTVRGENTPMLRHLCQCLCAEYGEDLEFHHQPGGYELIILRRTEDGLVPVSDREKVDIVNRAWKISLEVVAGHAV